MFRLVLMQEHRGFLMSRVPTGKKTHMLRSRSHWAWLMGMMRLTQSLLLSLSVWQFPFCKRESQGEGQSHLAKGSRGSISVSVTLSPLPYSTTLEEQKTSPVLSKSPLKLDTHIHSVWEDGFLNPFRRIPQPVYYLTSGAWSWCRSGQKALLAITNYHFNPYPFSPHCSEKSF